LSVARAVSVEVPCGAFFQVQLYGTLASVATTVPLRRNSTRATVPGGVFAGGGRRPSARSPSRTASHR
jgi:hypothetical protein